MLQLLSLHPKMALHLTTGMFLYPSENDLYVYLMSIGMNHTDELGTEYII